MAHDDRKVKHWEYYNAQQRQLQTAGPTKSSYAQCKIDVEPVFGRLKASLKFRRFLVRGLDKVTKEAGLLVLVLNILNLRSRLGPLLKTGVKIRVTK
ncbi:transposase [Lactobacillus sp. DCY120]|uniref:Transposase n=1 Tax=Bombilactobacillus apium TaxID=2675299 RepID=A0A850R0E4_9LACO|nr:transposase [Bombilactobacillus apium]